MGKLERQNDFSVYIRQGFDGIYDDGCEVCSSVTPTGYVIVKTTIDLDEKRMKCMVRCKKEDACEIESALKEAFEDYIKEVCDIFKYFSC